MPHLLLVSVSVKGGNNVKSRTENGRNITNLRLLAAPLLELPPKYLLDAAFSSTGATQYLIRISGLLKYHQLKEINDYGKSNVHFVML